MRLLVVISVAFVAGTLISVGCWYLIAKIFLGVFNGSI